ncbi:MAG: hypothetical protein KDM91_07730 [Verrucomicrobiae bacterium]|nr:hypothetical protein [Verrucomicrobiae bacterium]
MKSRQRKRPGKRDLHFLNADGMVACNPRDREAAHRAEMEGIATADPKAVTCRKCRIAIGRLKG